VPGLARATQSPKGVGGVTRSLQVEGGEALEEEARCTRNEETDAGTNHQWWGQWGLLAGSHGIGPSRDRNAQRVLRRVKVGST
jgi:hypothetical protein